MKVVALVSGGKDSCYNMMLCERYGHEVVALANLFPADDTKQELDSYMYQTVGHNLIEGYAECMGLPLFRKKLAGTSKNIEMTYEETEGDEVEDLRCLLARVKETMPQVQAVSCGAIRSDYQRVRVEGVCDSLGLISLSYMWRRDQSELLAEMVDNGLQSILIKVACLGLVPHKHLGKTIGQMQPKLEELSGQFGVHVCGEGGEYETLTLDCPLFKYGRIVVDKSRCVLDDSGEAGNFVVEEYHVEGKGGGEAGKGLGRVIQVESDLGGGRGVAGEMMSSLAVKEEGEGTATSHVSLEHRGSYKLLVGSLVARTSAAEMSTEDLVLSFRGLLQRMQAKVHEQGRRLQKSVIVYFSIKDMGNFAALNAVYKSFFGTTNPPPRCCIEMALEETELLRIEVLLPGKEDLDSRRRIMHVQSISQWAPCCIGPYSQAAQFSDLLYVSGQIGLDPPRMAFTEGEPIEDEMAKALLHCESVCEAMGASFREGTLKLVIYLAKGSGADGSRLGRMVDDALAEGVQKVYVEVPRLPKDARLELHPVLRPGAGLGDPCCRTFAFELADGKDWGEELERLDLAKEDVVMVHCYAAEAGGKLDTLRGLPVQSFPVTRCGLDQNMTARGVCEVIAHRCL
ncbi:diphthine--ammonia ligase [Chloropicon primus]|uniref:Diphthine--ammonia ligase n=1 Tax=Chloropicon primus TaxID=1764295 RepID=A0A5B8MVT9_9CHLO|nr:diphthine--ammonia ligase [Chloropicon primus]UPR03867.1 diphthine--ammonia ligase [Chloropicon primus]|eukprot:QDZ24659.1 diphthine--ammonia ligase [Chloropicon primus]